VSSETEGVPSIGGENIDPAGKMSYANVNRIPPEFAYLMNKGRLKAGDTLINKDGAQTGKVAQYDGVFPEAWINEHVFIVRGRSDQIHSDYLFYSLLDRRAQGQIARRITGSAQPGLSSDFAKAVSISLPRDMGRQSLIARILCLLDTKIEETEALLAKQECVRAGLMQDLFTRGVDEHGQLRPHCDATPDLYHETELGWFPVGWTVEDFGKRIDVIDPNPSHRYPAEVKEGIPICSTENFCGADAFDLSFSKHVPESTFISQNNRCRYHELDVVFARKGRIGLARRFGDTRKVFSHTVVVMKPLDRRTNRSWLLWLARCDVLLSGIAREMNTNSGVPTLGIEFIKSMQVPFPPEAEQAIIANMLDQQASAIRVLQDDLAKLRLQKAGLMQDLLTGEVSVAPLLESTAA